MQKVMLAEDDPTMLSLLSTLLKMEGFETCTLGLQDNVLEVIRRDLPDLVLLDVNLPQGNGIDILREIRHDDGIKNVVIVMSSGMPLEEESMKAGANAFLLKPYMPDTLISAIKTGLASV